MGAREAADTGGCVVKKARSANRKAAAKRSGAPKNIDEYLADVPEPGRGTLQKIPAFKYKGVLVWFAAFSKHCSLFPTAAVIEEFKDELKAYEISKGTIQFPLNKPLPAGLVKKMVKARVAQIQNKKK